jgi:uncharacterized RDD family membrane protein YckC
MSSVAKPSAVPTGPELDNRRIAAAGIDLAVPALIFALVAAAGYLTFGVAVVLVGWTLYYFFAFESAHGHQTLGKRAMNLRVTTPDGGAPSMRQVAMRTVVRVADGPLGLVAMIASGDRRQRLGDMAAGTVVADASAVASEAPTETLSPRAGVFHPRDLDAAGHDAPTEQLPAAAPAQPAPAEEPKKTRKTLGGPEIKLPKLRMPRMSKGPALRMPKLGRKPKDPVTAQAAPPAPAEPKQKKGRRSLGGPELKLPAFLKKDLSFGRGKKDPEPARRPATLPEPPAPAVPPTTPGRRRTDAEAAPAPATGFPEPAHDVTPMANRFTFDEDGPEVEVEVTPAEPVYDPEIEPMPEPSFDHVPDVEVVRPEPEESPAVDVSHHEPPEPDFDIPLPLPAQPEPQPEPAPAAAEAEPQQPAADDEDHVTVKPIETVSAIDLVMQDAQEGDGDEPEPHRPSL